MFGDYLVLSFFVAWATAAGGRPLFYLALPLLFAGIRATASNGALIALLGGCGAMVASTRASGPAGRSALLCLAGRSGSPSSACTARRSRRSRCGAERRPRRGRRRGAEGRARAVPDLGERLRRRCRDTDRRRPRELRERQRGASTGDYHGAHNEYLGMLGERGILGLAGWLALLAAVFAMLAPCRRRRRLPPARHRALFGLFGADRGPRARDRAVPLPAHLDGAGAPRGGRPAGGSSAAGRCVRGSSLRRGARRGALRGSLNLVEIFRDARRLPPPSPLLRSPTLCPAELRA